jgi:hypothetical protein
MDEKRTRNFNLINNGTSNDKLIKEKILILTGKR